MAAESQARGTGVAWNLGSAALPLVGSFVVSVLLAPYLGPAEFGRYMTAISAATLALIIAKFGVHAATSKLLSEHNDAGRVWLRAGLILRSAATVPMALLAVVAAAPLARALEGENLVPTFQWLWVVILAASYFEMGSEALVGLRSFRALLLSRVAGMVLRIGAVFYVQAAQLGSAAFLLGHALSQALPALAILIPLSLRLPSGAPPTQLSDAVRRTWKISLPLAVGSASYLIYAHTDRLMIAWFDDSSAVGQFAVARNILDAILFPLFALSWSFRPALIHAWADSKLRHRVLSSGGDLYLHFALTGGALCVIVLPRLLVTIYGPDYEMAARLLSWMTPILVLRSLGAPLLPGLLAADRQASYARWMGMTAAVNVAANLLLIPRFGAHGAVLGTVIALLALTLGGWRELWSAGGRIRPDIRSWLPSVVAAGALLALSPWIAPAGGSLLRQLIGSAVVAPLVLAPFLRPQRWR